MRKSVIVNCPARIDLFDNYILKRDGKYEVKKIIQLINIYNTIKIYNKFDSKPGIIIRIDNKEISDTSNIYYIVTKLYLEYKKININNIIIDIESLIPNIGLYNTSSNIAGIVMGLDRYFGLDSKEDELYDFLYKIDKESALFIKNSCLKVTSYGNKVKRYDVNPYNKYLIIGENNSVNNPANISCFGNKEIPNNLVHSDFDNLLSKRLREVKKYVESISEDYNITSSHFGSNLVICLRKQNINTNLKYKLKKEFPDLVYVSAENSKGIKRLTLYKTIKD